MVYIPTLNTVPVGYYSQAMAILGVSIFIHADYRKFSIGDDSLTPLRQHSVWVGSWSCGFFAAWFCYQLIPKPDNETAAPP